MTNGYYIPPEGVTTTGIPAMATITGKPYPNEQFVNNPDAVSRIVNDLDEILDALGYLESTIELKDHDARRLLEDLQKFRQNIYEIKDFNIPKILEMEDL